MSTFQNKNPKRERSWRSKEDLESYGQRRCKVSNPEAENILYTYLTICVFGPVPSDQTNVWRLCRTACTCLYYVESWHQFCKFCHHSGSVAIFHCENELADSSSCEQVDSRASTWACNCRFMHASGRYPSKRNRFGWKPHNTGTRSFLLVIRLKLEAQLDLLRILQAFSLNELQGLKDQQTLPSSLEISRDGMRTILQITEKKTSSAIPTWLCSYTRIVRLLMRQFNYLL